MHSHLAWICTKLFDACTLLPDDKHTTVPFAQQKEKPRRITDTQVRKAWRVIKSKLDLETYEQLIQVKFLFLKPQVTAVEDASSHNAWSAGGAGSTPACRSEF